MHTYRFSPYSFNPANENGALKKSMRKYKIFQRTFTSRLIGLTHVSGLNVYTFYYKQIRSQYNHKSAKMPHARLSEIFTNAIRNNYCRYM